MQRDSSEEASCEGMLWRLGWSLQVATSDTRTIIRLIRTNDSREASEERLRRDVRLMILTDRRGSLLVRGAAARLQCTRSDCEPPAVQEMALP